MTMAREIMKKYVAALAVHGCRQRDAPEAGKEKKKIVVPTKSNNEKSGKGCC